MIGSQAQASTSSPSAIGTEPAHHRSGMKVIENRTAKRIGIAARDKANTQVIIPPFGKRAIAPEALEQLDYRRWDEQHLVRVYDEEVASTRGSRALGLKALRQWVSQSVTLLLTLLVAIGFPSIFIAALIHTEELNYITDMALLFLLAFVTVCSTLPMLLYFLFDRQKAEFLRQDFLRSVLRLDPNLQTVDDAEIIYGPTIDTVYGVGGRIGLPILISTLLITLGWSITILPDVDRINTINTTSSGSLADALETLFTPHLAPVIFGFLGGYFFAIGMIFRRYVRADLGPKAYSHITVRIIVTVILVWVISTLPPLATSADDTLLLVFAFTVGIIPENAVVAIQDFLRSYRGVREHIPSLQEDHPLTNLDGITLYDRARLLEEGIENIENLAHHDLVELMLRTWIPPSRLIDLVDQSVLYLHARNGAGGTVAGADAVSAIEVLRGYGIRTATDLEQAYAASARRQQAGPFLALLGSEGAGVTRLRVILDTMKDDEWMLYLRHWCDGNRVGKKVYTLHDFYSGQANSFASCVEHTSP